MNERWEISVDDLLEVYFANNSNDLPEGHSWEVDQITNFNSREIWVVGGQADVLVHVYKDKDA